MIEMNGKNSLWFSLLMVLIVSLILWGVIIFAIFYGTEAQAGIEASVSGAEWRLE